MTRERSSRRQPAGVLGEAQLPPSDSTSPPPPPASCVLPAPQIEQLRSIRGTSTCHLTSATIPRRASGTGTPRRRLQDAEPAATPARMIACARPNRTARGPARAIAVGRSRNEEVMLDEKTWCEAASSANLHLPSACQKPWTRTSRQGRGTSISYRIRTSTAPSRGAQTPRDRRELVFRRSPASQRQKAGATVAADSQSGQGQN